MLRANSNRRKIAKDLSRRPPRITNHLSLKKMRRREEKTIRKIAKKLRNKSPSKRPSRLLKLARRRMPRIRKEPTRRMPIQNR
jgi:hypothetical protein